MNARNFLPTSPMFDSVELVRDEPKAKFGIGHKVRRIEFTDCFGVHHPASAVLTVSRVSFVHSDPDYFHVLAYGVVHFTNGCSGHESHDGAERFFEFAEEAQS